MKIKILNFFLYIFAATFFLHLQQNTFSQESQNLKLPHMFSDNMVLQRNSTISIWGWAKPGGTVAVELNGKKVATLANVDGKWMAELPAQKTGGPYTLFVASGEQTISYANVMLGDVFLASGQSNMYMPFSWGVKNKEEEIKAADYPNIRLFQAPKFTSEIPEDDFNGGEWQVCTPENILPFSAAAYFFARDIHLDKKIPVGIIHSSWGGTKCEVWTSYDMLKTLPDFRGKVIDIENNPENIRELFDENQEKVKRLGGIMTSSNNGVKIKAHTKYYNDSKWDTITNPCSWENNALDKHRGFVWFRKEFSVPSKMAGMECIVSLGKIHYFDKAYINGVEIGSSEDPLNFRKYAVPKKLIKSGNNIIAVRVLSTFGVGGFKSAPEEMFLSVKNKKDEFSIPLNGVWKFNKYIEPELPETERYHDRLAALYNAMIHPIIPYGLKGILWYQGNSNRHKAYQYRSLLPAMITDWRIRFEQGYLPFIIVQHANYGEHPQQPVEDKVAEIREAQLLTAMTYPNCALVTTIDIGDASNIHPGNKQDLGKRMAIAARKLCYNDDIVYSGPIYKQMKIEKDKIVLEFDHIGSGLTTGSDETLKGFSIAGGDKKFYWAEASIVGNKVIVSSSKVSSPVAVRYAWSYNPDCNLYNKEGLPASPFRTDDWPGLTYE